MSHSTGNSIFEIIPEFYIFIRFIATSNKIATPLKANGTENFSDHSGEISQKAVRKNDAHIEKHHTQERTPAMKVSGTMSPSYSIPANSRSFRKMFPGPASFTNREDIRHIANPYTIKSIMSMPAFYSKIGGCKTLHQMYNHDRILYMRTKPKLPKNHKPVRPDIGEVFAKMLFECRDKINEDGTNRWSYTVAARRMIFEAWKRVFPDRVPPKEALDMLKPFYKDLDF